MATYIANPLFEDDDLGPIDMILEEAYSEELPTDETSGLPMLSRRAMLGGLFASSLATCGMMLLPKENGGVLFAGFNPLGAEKAYAASGPIWTGSFTFKVVGADEVGIQIMDVSDLTDLDDEEIKDKGKPVEDATVTLTSLYNGATVSDDTDDQGKVILPIRDLAFSTVGTDGVYRANCTITVTTKNARLKMRDFSTGRVCLEGAYGYIIGTHKVDDSDVYMERCTFDDWDIHYSKLTFLRSKINEDTHTIDVRIKGATSDVEVSMEVLDAEDKKTVVLKERSTTAKYDSASGLATCTFKGKFLNEGHSDCIKENDVIIRITLNSGGKSYVSDLEMRIEDTPFEDATLSKPILPLTSDAGAIFSFKTEAPNKKKWPCFNGMSFSVLSPFPEVQVSTTIATTVVGIGTDARMVADGGGWAPKDCWKKDHTGNMIRRFKNELGRQQDELEKRKNAGKEIEMKDIHAPGDEEEVMPQTKSQKEPFLNCDLNIVFRLALMFQWDAAANNWSDLKSFSGQGTVELGFSISGTFTIEFTLGPFPAYLSITLGLTALGCFSVACTHQLQQRVKELDCAEMGWTVDKSAGLLLKFLLAVSLGIGYRGLFSLSFDATFTFPIYFGWKEAHGEGKHDPHTTVGVTILLEVVLQVLLFKLSGQIFSYSDDGWYNNWDESSAAALTGDDAWDGIEPRFRLTQKDGSFRHTLIYDNEGVLLAGNGADPFADAVPTTDAMMMNTREANARKSSGTSVSALSDEEFESYKETHSAEFAVVEGATGVFKREAGTAGVETPTYVFVGKMPKAVVGDDGTITTELVDCEGVNTFYFGEMTSDMIAAAVGSAGAAVATQSATANGTAATQGATADGAAAAQSATADGAVDHTNSVAPSAMLTTAALTTQEGEHFEGDPLLGFALGTTHEYEYDAVAGKTTGEPCGPTGVKGIGLHDGVVPKVNSIIYQNVHSDPRQRVVSIGGVLYLFRIVTVKYPDAEGGSYCRSRVVGSRFDAATQTWGEPKVLEYSTGNRDLPRVKIYDYEFDIAVRTGNKSWTQDAEACLIVTGGLRPEGDGTSFHTAASQCTVAVLAINADLEVLQVMVRGVSSIDTTDAKLGFSENEKHMVCSPCIVDGFAADGASGSLAYAFLRRSSGSKVGLASTGASVTFCVGHCYVRDGYLSFPTDLKEDSSIALAADVFGMKGVAGKAVAKKYDALLTLLVNHQQGYDVCTATIPPGGDFSKLAITHCIASTDKLPEIQPWPQHGTFLYVKERPTLVNSSDADYHLYQGTFDALASGQARFGAQQVDTAGIKGASFCVSPNGEYVFYYESYRDRKNSNPEAAFTSSTVTGTGDDSIRHIMASRLMNGKFCEDFPFCEIDHPIDHFEVLSLDDDTSAFIATHITDANNSLADIHYIGVPNVLSAEIEAFVQTDPFVCAGKTASFSMDVRNHGNMIIGGFDVQMLDPDDSGRVVGTAHVGGIEPSKIALDAAHMGWGHTASDTPQLSAEEKQGMLMPGKKISYPAEFKIPDTWEGTKTVILRITNAWTPKMGASDLQTQAATDSAIDFTEENNGMVVRALERGIHHYHVATQGGISVVNDGQGEGTVYDPAEWVGANPSPVNPNDKGGGSGTGPKTGDDLGPFGPIALAAAGAAALVAGYSARRARIEREAREEQGSEE